MPRVYWDGRSQSEARARRYARDLATLKDLATETEKTARQFHRDKSSLDDEGRYYRFNVDHGLEEIGLEESKRTNEIVAATRRYMEAQTVFKQIKACANNLAGRDC